MFKPWTRASLWKSLTVLAWLPDPTYFFALMQKSSKKNQGFRKMAKNYFVSLSPANSLLDCIRVLVNLRSNPDNHRDRLPYAAL